MRAIRYSVRGTGMAINPRSRYRPHQQCSHRQHSAICILLLTCLILHVRCDPDKLSDPLGFGAREEKRDNSRIARGSEHRDTGKPTSQSSESSLSLPHREDKSLDLDGLRDYSSSKEVNDSGDLDSSASMSVSSKETDPLQLILPKVKFVCKGRPEGYYADVDFDCEVFHYCKTNGFRFTFVCPPNSKFNQKQMTCDYEAKENICTGLLEKRKQPPPDDEATPVDPPLQQPAVTTTTLITTTTSSSAASSSFSAESSEAENEGKLAPSVIAFSSNDLLSNKRWPDFDTQSQESHARPVIHQDKDSGDNVYPFDSRLTTKSDDEGSGVVYWNASNIDSDTSGNQDQDRERKEKKGNGKESYYFTGTSISDRYVSSQNNPKLMRTTTPLPSTDPQPVYVSEHDFRSSTARPFDSREEKVTASSNMIHSTESSFFDHAPPVTSMSTFKPIFGYRNTASPSMTKSRNHFGPYTTTTTSPTTTSTTTTTTTTPAPSTSTMAPSPVEHYVVEVVSPRPTDQSQTATLITSSPVSSAGPTSSFTWNQEMGSGFKPVTNPGPRKEKKDSLIFQGSDMLAGNPLAEPEASSYLKVGSAGDTSLEALYADSGPLSTARLHELLSGSPHFHNNLMSSSNAHSLQQFLSESNQFQTQPLIFEPMSETSVTDQSYQLHPNLTFPSSTLSPVDPTAFVYETVTISHPSSPFSTESSESSPANPAFLTGFRQYPTISPPPPHMGHHPHPQQALGLMTHFFPQSPPIPRFPPSIPLSGNKVTGNHRDQHMGNSYIYLPRPHHSPPPPPPSPSSSDHLLHPHQHPLQQQASHMNPLMSEFQQLPAAIQNQIAHQLGLVPPKSASKFVSQSEEGSSEDVAFKVSSPIFGLPKLRPVKVASHFEDAPKHNFHTQNPNLMPSHLLAGSQVHVQGTKQPRAQKQQQQAITSSIMAEINSLLKQNIFTRPRSLSMRPVMSEKAPSPLLQPAGAGNQFPLKITQNPFTSWFSKSSSAKGNQDPGFNLMAASSQSSYPSFADPPNVISAPSSPPQPRRKRKFLSNLSKLFQTQSQDHEYFHHQQNTGFQFPSTMHHQIVHAKDLPANNMNLVKRPPVSSSQNHIHKHAFTEQRMGSKNINLSTNVTPRSLPTIVSKWSPATTQHSLPSSAISPTFIPPITTHASNTTDPPVMSPDPRPPYYFRSFYPEAFNHSSFSSHVTRDVISRIDPPLNYTHSRTHRSPVQQVRLW